MTESFTKWDVTEHLRTQEDVRLYLEACAEEDLGDRSLICAALNDIARAGNMTEKGKGGDPARPSQDQLPSSDDRRTIQAFSRS